MGAVLPKGQDLSPSHLPGSLTAKIETPSHTPGGQDSGPRELNDSPILPTPKV